MEIGRIFTKYVKQSPYSLGRLLWLQEVEAPIIPDNWHVKVIRLSAVGTGRLYPPGNTLLPISGRS